MDLVQGKSVDATAFQTIVDGNFGSGNATGTIGGNSYIITVKRTGINYQMDSNGNISELAELPIDSAPGVLEQSGNIYTINSIEDLVAFSYNVNSGTELYEGKTVTLGRDLDFQNDSSYADASAKYKKDDNGYAPDTTSTTTIKSFMTNTEGEGFVVIGNQGFSGNKFAGNFDGKDKSLSNLYINSTSKAAFFGLIDKSIEIKNLSLVSCNIKGKEQAAGLVGFAAGNLKINNISVSGNIESTSTSDYAGGIIGFATFDLEINNCSNSSNVTSNSITGGIISMNSSNNIVINNCWNSGVIISSSSGSAGGIAGQCKGKITNCYNTREVNSSAAAGGIIGVDNGGSIINCYNKGIIESTVSGGIFGNCGSNLEIVNCFNNGEIQGNGIAGGIQGSGSNTVISNCYNFKGITSNNKAGGISGEAKSITKCFNSGKVEVKGDSNPVGGITGGINGGSITYCHNTGSVIGGSINGEIHPYLQVDNTNDYLKKDVNATTYKNAVEKTQAEMDEIMSVQNFVNLMNSYVTGNNADSTKTELKTWKVENELPVFAE